jgi:hypothetical protein
LEEREVERRLNYPTSLPWESRYSIIEIVLSSTIYLSNDQPRKLYWKDIWWFFCLIVTQ